MKHFVIWVIFFMSIVGCKCPQLLTPTIIANSKQPVIGSSLILTTNQQKNTVAYWTGPTGTYIGNTWIVENVSKQMSGNYTLMYGYKRRRKCKSSVTTEQINIRECPRLPAPKILSNSDQINIGTPLLLAISSIENTNVVWKTPDSVFMGNTLSSEKVTKKMEGIYSAKYVYPEIKGCESQSSSKTIFIVDRLIEAKYNSSTYYVDFATEGNITKVWFRADKIKNDPKKDIQVMQLEMKQMTMKNAKEEYCRYVDAIGKSKFVVGCAKTAGAAGCLLGSVATEGALVPVCAGLLINPTPALVDCIMGLAGEIAKSAGGEIPFEAAQAATNISKGDMQGIIESIINFPCIDFEGKVPSINGEGKAVGKAVPAPGPTPGKPQTNGGGRGEGHEYPNAGGNRGGGNNGGNNGGGNTGGNNGGGNRGGGNNGGNRGGGGIPGGRIPLFKNAPNFSQKEDSLGQVLNEATAISNVKSDDILIGDTITAVHLAETFLFKKYGEKEITKERPYQVQYSKNYWIIIGGGKNNSKKFIIIIDATNGQVIKIDRQ